MQVSVSLTATGFDVAADLQRIAALTETLPNDLATVAADAGITNVLDEVVAIRGTLSMSNNAQARTLDALPIVRPGTPHAEAEIVAIPRGAWHLVEYGARPHEIRPKRGPGGRRGVAGTKKAMTVGSYGIFGKVNHPGTTATGVWEKAMEAAEPAIIEVVETAWSVAVESDGSGAI